MLIGLVCFLLCTLCRCTITAAHSLKEAARSWSSSSSRNCRNWGNPSTKGSKKYCENSSQLSPLPVDCLKWHWLVPKKTGWAPQNLGVTPFQNRQPYASHLDFAVVDGGRWASAPFTARLVFKYNVIIVVQNRFFNTTFCFCWQVLLLYFKHLAFHMTKHYNG